MLSSSGVAPARGGTYWGVDIHSVYMYRVQEMPHGSKPHAVHIPLGPEVSLEGPTPD